MIQIIGVPYDPLTTLRIFSVFDLKHIKFHSLIVIVRMKLVYLKHLKLLWIVEDTISTSLVRVDIILLV